MVYVTKNQPYEPIQTKASLSVRYLFYTSPGMFNNDNTNNDDDDDNSINTRTIVIVLLSMAKPYARVY